MELWKKGALLFRPKLPDVDLEKYLPLLLVTLIMGLLSKLSVRAVLALFLTVSSLVGVHMQ